MNAAPKPILIVLIAGIGDLVLASQSIRSIKKGNPDSPIHLLTSTQAAPLAHNYPYIDHVRVFPITEFNQRKLSGFSIVRLIKTLRETTYAMAVNLYRVYSWSGALKMGLLFLSLNAEVKIGHDNKGFGFFLDKKVPGAAFLNQHIADAMFDIAILAGGIEHDKGLEVFSHESTGNKLNDRFSNNEESEAAVRIGINPGGARQNRRWNPDNYAAAADTLSRKLNARIIILGGPGEESIAQSIADRMQTESINLAGTLTLNDLVYVIAGLDLLITNDSAPMHIAAAAKTPLVAIIGPENPVFFGPYTSPVLHRVLHKSVPCRPCHKGECESPICLTSITVDEVVTTSLNLLDNSS